MAKVKKDVEQPVPEGRIAVVYIATELIDEPEWNPNEMSPEMFNELVKNIRDFGFKEPVLLTPRQDKPGRYLSISGSHRVKAARVIPLTEVPAIVEEKFDDEMQQFQNMKFNVIKGKLDPLKFSAMFDKLSAKYGKEVTAAMMSFVDKAAFDAVYRQVREAVPKELQKELDKAKKEIKTIDGLAAVLNEMFQKNGNTLDKGYMVFSYGGQSHLWIIMDERTKKFSDSLKKRTMATGRNINDLFYDTLFPDKEKQGGTDPVVPKDAAVDSKDDMFA